MTFRGNARQPIFLDKGDFTDFLRVLCSVVKRYHFILHTYCLMNNHHHLLIETPDANLSRGMRQLNGLYTQRFNQRHKRVNQLFQGTLSLCGLKPGKGKNGKNPKDWRWSSYQATTGYKGVSCLTTS